MNKSVVAGVVVGGVLLFATGFGTGFAVKDGGDSKSVGAATRSEQPSTPVTTNTPVATGSPTNDRGAHEVVFGKPAGLSCDPGPCAVEFTLDTPFDATECESGYPPENGRLIAIPITVATQQDPDLYASDGMWNPNNFSAVRANGVTTPRVTSAATYGCAQSGQEIPSTMAPASNYEGFVVLDIPDDAKSILFFFDDSISWEWELP